MASDGVLCAADVGPTHDPDLKTKTKGTSELAKVCLPKGSPLSHSELSPIDRYLVPLRPLIAWQDLYRCRSYLLLTICGMTGSRNLLENTSPNDVRDVLKVSGSVPRRVRIPLMDGCVFRLAENGNGLAAV